ncbi:MAG TPA: crotonase/enoyl-CoA hydratase family protein [Thermodesulfobacteriota bacterium]|nr:crotonase/enoyl-CoA hydratase family protein [Thermodesulfobacteriota bacterium]
MANYEHLQCRIEDRIMTMVLNRPDRLNAVNAKMLKEMIQAFEEADRDDEVRVIIVTGAGKAFCAGADLGPREDTWAYHSEKMEDHRDGGGTVTLKIFEMKKPVIAAINGPAAGFGITMTLPMDIRIAADTAKMGFVFARRGIVPDACCTWFLPRIVGISRAAEWTLTGRIFPASEALENGLVSRVVPSDQLLDTAKKIAREIAENTSAVSVALTRQLLWRMLGADHPMEAHRIDSKCIYYLGKSDESTEGVLSFLERRPPKFTMKPSSDMPVFYPWWEEKPFEKESGGG